MCCSVLLIVFLISKHSFDNVVCYLDFLEREKKNLSITLLILCSHYHNIEISDPCERGKHHCLQTITIF